MNLSLARRFFPAHKNFSGLAGALNGIAIGLIILFLSGLPMRWTVAIVISFAIFLAILIVGKPRSMFLSLLILSIAANFNLHIAYREDYIGVSDGITIGTLQISLILLLLLWIHDLWFVKRRKLHFFPNTTVPAIFLVLSALLSVLNSGDKILSLYGIVAYVELFVFYFYIANNVNTKQDLKLVLVTFQVCLLLQGSVCLLQAILKTNFTTQLFKTFDEIPNSEIIRPVGLIGSPNYAGAYLAGLIPIQLVHFIMLSGKSKKIAAFVILLIGSAGLILTLSRGAWFSVAIASVPVAILLLHYHFIKIRHVVLTLLPIIGLLILFREIIFLRISEGPENLVNRGHLIWTAANMVKAHPIIGIGINTYTTVMESYTPWEFTSDWTYLVHNAYMLVWSEMGTLALINFLWLLAITLKAAFELTRSSDPFISIAAIGLFGSLATCIIDMNFESYSFGPNVHHLWLLIAVIVGLNRFREIRSI